MNSVVWGLKDKPFKRLDGPQETLYDALINGFDLVLDLTATSWEHGVANRAHQGKNEVQSRTRFAFSRMLSAGKWALFNGAIASIILELLGSPGHGSPQTTIFDANLPPVWRYLKGCLISILTALSAVGGMHASMDIIAGTAVLLGSSPTKWSPSFRSPWRSTSVSSFWGYRWHQLTRVTFLYFGGKPLAAITGSGRLGLVMGTFIASGIAHEAGTVRMPTARAKEGQGALLFFAMMGVGVVLEHLWAKITGRKVRGVLGWFWTIGWLTAWGNHYVDRSLRVGMVEILPTKYIPGNARPLKMLWEFAVGRHAPQVA